jgi:hypothetical protein
MNTTYRKTNRLIRILAVISIVILTISNTQAKLNAPHSQAGKQGVTGDSVVREWNEIAFTTIPPQPPFPANRSMAIVQVAVFEAVNSITGKYAPYLGTISAPPGASAEAAAVMAAHGVLVALLPAQAANLDARRDASLALIPDGQAKVDGMTVGTVSAAAMLANRANDGSTPAAFYMPTNSDPYEWQVYAGCPAAGGAFFHWQNLRPFAIESSSQFRSEPPPALDSGVYARDYNEVRMVGANNASPDDRPQDRADVALLYAIANPPALWNSVLLQIASTRNDEITDTAHTMALMNIATSDAAVSVFDSKYFYRTWRPVTAISRGDDDGNKWTTAGPFVQYVAATPCFPSYPSAHGSLSGAAAKVLERAYGRFGHSITVQHTSVPGVVLGYSDIRDMIDDISDARVYGGIHFRFDQVAGGRQGDAIGQFVYNNILKKAGDE